MGTKTFEKRLQLAARWLKECSYFVAFTGAGISTDSGLPDFRGPDGVWTRRDKGLPPPKSTVPRSEIKPNAGHLALVELQKRGILKFLISQNVDNLHIASGLQLELLAELHGNGQRMKCLACDERFSKVELGWDNRKWGTAYRTQKPINGQPACPSCNGRLISSVVNFNDPMPDKEMRDSQYHSERCDLFFAIGSSLVVSPANEFPRIAKEKGAKLVILNRGETPLDGLADLTFAEGISEVLPALVHLLNQ